MAEFDHTDPAPIHVPETVENQQTTQQTEGNKGFNERWNGDDKGRVDIREIAQDFIDLDPENAGTFDEPPPPASEQPKQATPGNQPPTPEPLATEAVVNEFIDGDLAFETIDFFLVSLLLTLSKEEDESKYAVPGNRKRKLILIWDKYLKTIDYKIPIHYALILLYVASYGPLTFKAFQEDRKKKASTPANGGNFAGPSVQVNNEPVNIPDPLKIKLPKNPRTGNYTKFEKEQRDIILDQSKHIDDLRKVIEDMNRKNNTSVNVPEPEITHTEETPSETDEPGTTN